MHMIAYCKGVWYVHIVLQLYWSPLVNFSTLPLQQSFFFLMQNLKLEFCESCLLSNITVLVPSMCGFSWENNASFWFFWKQKKSQCLTNVAKMM